MASISPSGIINAFETCQIFLACLYIDLIRYGFEWPKELTAMPWTKSKYLLPLVEYKKLPLPFLKAIFLLLYFLAKADMFMI